jgi:hypothetical protein
MKTFKFIAFGKTFVTEADHFLVAMTAANDFHPLGAGAWFETTETEFRWVEGNFSD